MKRLVRSTKTGIFCTQCDKSIPVNTSRIIDGGMHSHYECLNKLKLKDIFMKVGDKRRVGSILERGGIAQRIIMIADDIAKGTYKNAIEKGARIAELIQAASYDQYWDEKAENGKQDELFQFELLLKGKTNRNVLMTKMRHQYKDT